MSELEKKIEKAMLTKLMFLNAAIVGIVTGIFIGFGVFFATIFLLIKGGPVVGPHLALLGQYFIGYKVTFVGSLIGLGYGFIFGFVVGYTISWLYNFFANLRSRNHN